MKRVSIVLSLVIFGIGFLSAQKSKVTTGTLNFTQGSYASAISNLNLALEKPELLKPKHLAKAHYFLYKSYYQISVDTSQKAKDALAESPKALIKAKHHLEEAMGNTEYDQFKKDANKYDISGQNDLSRLWGALYNKGVSVFNDQGDDNLALEYFVAADDVIDDHFLTKRMVGSSYIAVKDTTNAIKIFEEAVEVFKSTYDDSKEGVAELKESEDYKIDAGQLSYISQMLGILYQSQGDFTNALKAINTGLEVLPGDKDIEKIELHIYQQNPELFEQAKTKFEAAMKNEPDNINVKLAYADLLTKNNETLAAKDLYDQIYELDSENFMANFGKGAFYINKAAEISDAKMKLGTSSNDEEKIDTMNKEIVELLKKAYPFMKWLHEHDEKNTEWLRQLVNITPLIGKDDEMMEYGKKLGDLNKN